MLFFLADTIRGGGRALFDVRVDILFEEIRYRRRSLKKLVCANRPRPYQAVFARAN